MRVTGIYGDINEEKCSETLFSLLLLAESSKEIVPGENPEDEDIEITLPIDFYVSTHGGSATEMFGLYDMIRQIRDVCPINTIGLGKVMSAGVLLLAAGSKGERRVGANCRIMLHGVVSGQQGYLADIENEFEEAKFTQELYAKALAEETNMSLKYIKKLLQRKTNVYLSAKEAVELGIADIVV
jgi:ATP-dependent Clp protease protease subunit